VKLLKVLVWEYRRAFPLVEQTARHLGLQKACLWVRPSLGKQMGSRLGRRSVHSWGWWLGVTKGLSLAPHWAYQLVGSLARRLANLLVEQMETHSGVTWG